MTGTAYELYLTIWVDADETVSSTDQRSGSILDSVSCAVVSANGTGSTIPYAYQVMIPYTILAGGAPSQPHFFVEVTHPTDSSKKSKVIIHHADADQPAV